MDFLGLIFKKNLADSCWFLQSYQHQFYISSDMGEKEDKAHHLVKTTDFETK